MVRAALIFFAISLLFSCGYLWLTSLLLRGPLIFCLLLSLFLSFCAQKDQKSLVFSGVFSIVWIGEAVVTLQIKLLGGNMYVSTRPPSVTDGLQEPVFWLTMSLPLQ